MERRLKARAAALMRAEIAERCPMARVQLPRTGWTTTAASTNRLKVALDLTIDGERMDPGLLALLARLLSAP